MTFMNDSTPTSTPTIAWKHSRATRYKVEMEHRCQFDAKHGAPGAIRAPPALGAPGLHPFTSRLRAIRWHAGFKIVEVDTYDGNANPVQWFMLYEIAVTAAGRSEDVMGNYLPIMLNQSTNN